MPDFQEIHEFSQLDLVVTFLRSRTKFNLFYMYLLLLAFGGLRFLVLFEQVFAKVHHPAYGWFCHRRDLYKIQPTFFRNVNRRFERHDTRLFSGGIYHPNLGRLNLFITPDALWGSDISILLAKAVPRTLQQSYRGTRIL